MKKLKLEELGRLNIDDYKSSTKIPIVLVADNIRSGLNVGSFFRSADAFAIEKLILCGLSPTPPHKEINKSAIGASRSVDWEYVESTKDAIIQLREDNYFIIGIEQTTMSKPLSSYTLAHPKVAIVMGNEVEGISTDALALLDEAIEISQYGTKHSLNVAVCAGVCLWEFAKQMRTS